MPSAVEPTPPLFTGAGAEGTTTLAGVEHASIDLDLNAGPEPAHPSTWAGSSSRAGALRDAQRDLDDGPSLRAVRTGTVVNMTLAENHAAWPALSAAAGAGSVHAVLAVPLSLVGPAGCLTLHRSDPGPLDPASRTVLGLLADAIARTVTAQQAAAAGARLTEQFTDALRWRAPLEQAKGILMAVHQVDADAAFALLRRESQRTNVRLRDLAVAFVAEHTGHDGDATTLATPAPRNPTASPSRTGDYRAAAELAPVGIAVAELDGLVLSVNRALCQLLSHDEADLVGSTLAEHTHPDDLSALRSPIAALVRGEIPTSRVRARLLSAVGVEVPVTVTTALVLDPHGQEPHLVLHVEDATQTRLADRSRHDALHDPLTGLPNRTLLLDRLEVAVARRRDHGTPITVLYFDVDRFKAINDAYGHAVGDAVLTGLARHLSAAVRPGDTVARVGGDEFVVVAPDGDSQVVVERLAAALAHPVDLDGVPHPVQVAVGLTTTNGYPGARTPAELLHSADLDMYGVKRRAAQRAAAALDHRRARLATPPHR